MSTGGSIFRRLRAKDEQRRASKDEPPAKSGLPLGGEWHGNAGDYVVRAKDEQRTRSPELTKLRLQRDQAKRAHDETSRVFNDAQTAYFQACQSRGFCSECDAALPECRCDIRAKDEQRLAGYWQLADELWDVYLHADQGQELAELKAAISAARWSTIYGP